MSAADKETGVELATVADDPSSSTSGAPSAGAGAGGNDVAVSSLGQRAKEHHENWMHPKDIAKELPRVNVSIRGLKYEQDIDASKHDVRNVVGAMIDGVQFWKKKQQKTIHILNSMDIDCPAGSMSLILGAPGAGKSSLLGAVANRFPFEGQILFNGKTGEETKADMRNVVALVDQEDIHMPMLTVRETLYYAARLDSALSPEEVNNKVEAVIKVFQLSSCRDTIVGNAFIRGISGGEKRRLTVAEMLMANPRVVCLDEITTGLDSSTSYDILAALRQWCDTSGGTVIATLLQPIPEVYNMFDQVIMLQSGHCVYAGPRTDALSFLEAATGMACPVDQDIADFIVDYLADPEAMRLRELEIAEHARTERANSSGNEAKGIEEVKLDDAGPASSAISVPDQVLTPAQLSKTFRDLHPTSESILSGPDLLGTDFADRQYGKSYHNSLPREIGICCERQAKLYFRDKENYIFPWIQQAIVQGLIVGSLWWQLDRDDFATKFGYMFFIVTQVTFFNMVEIAIASDAKQIVYKQLDAGFYRATSYIAATAILHLPFAIINVLLFFIPSYFMVGFSDEPSDFFRFVGIFFSVDLAMSAGFRLVALLSPTAVVAQVLAPCLGTLAILFSGFVITRNNIPDWLIWMYFLDPFAYTIRAWGIIEFNSDDYNVNLPPTNQHLGDFYLDQFEIQKEEGWVQIGAVFNVLFYVIILTLSVLSIKFIRWAKIAGTTRPEDRDDNSVSVSVKTESSTSTLPFVPVTLSWSNLCYSVPKVENPLLTNITGRALPGKLIALMGASGAGKTTLLDVLADRKFVGTTTGNVLINGKPRDDHLFRRIVGYVQQVDAHVGTSTVREALLFSAHLRLPATVSEEQRVALVEEVLDLLELRPVADWLIGGSETDGISASQRKRLTIGVELVANPSILFLDEPTTGLDSRAAMEVVRVIRNVGNTGRTIICTVHQPSSELFFAFDELLLLQRGGRQLYFGDVGYRGKTLVDFFQAMPDVDPMPARMNPSTWILDISSAEGSSSKLNPEDFVKFYSDSGNKAFAEAEMQKASAPVEGDIASSGAAEAPVGRQLNLLMRRMLVANWRSLGYNITRLLICIIVGLIFGLCFYDLDRNDFASVQSMIGCLSFITGFVAVVLAQTIAPYYLGQRDSFYRETASRVYKPFLYAVSLAVTELPWVALFSIGHVVPAYFLIGFDSDPAEFFMLWFSVFVLGVALTYLYVSFAALLPNIAVIMIVGGLCQNLFWLFNGLFIPAPSVPQGWKWFQQAMPYRHSLYVMVATQVTNDNVIDTGLGGLVKEPAFVDEAFGFDADNQERELGVQFVYVVLFAAFMILGFTFVRHSK